MAKVLTIELELPEDFGDAKARELDTLLHQIVTEILVGNGHGLIRPDPDEIEATGEWGVREGHFVQDYGNEDEGGAPVGGPEPGSGAEGA